MPEERASSVVAHPAQWRHCAHQHTALLPGGGVQLTWSEAATKAARGCAPPGRADPGGLVFDGWCVGYLARPDTGALLALPPGISTVSRCPGAYVRPAGLAVDAARRLYVTDPGSREAVVIDLEQRRLLRRFHLPGSRPLDATGHCGRVLVLLREPAALLWLEGRRDPRPGPPLRAPRCPPGLVPARITSGPLVLWTRPDAAAVARTDGTVEFEIDTTATDLDLSAAGVLVVARTPGLPFRRFRQEGDGWVELEPVGAPGYDGGAVAHTPAGRIAYTTGTGIATTTGPQTAHEAVGTVTSYRLDSGSYRTRWGRIFLDACLPPRTAVTVRFVTSDADTVPDPIEPSAPDRHLIGRVPADDRLDYPPLPSAAALDVAPEAGAVFRRPNGPERGGSREGADGFETYEAPVHAPSGRYLGFQLTLTGTDQTSPRVRAVRVERPGHQLLNSLPLAWSRSDPDADFLHRYLTPVEGMLHELDWRSAQRAVLLDPRATPTEKMDWLAGFAGLVLDRRWSVAARRTLIAQAYPLFALRGTKAALLRLLGLYLGREPKLIEQWQLRGLGGATLGLDPNGPAAPRVEGSARLSAALGRYVVGGATASSDSYRESAHRCTVLIPGTLNAEQREVVESLLEAHRPAHVVIGLCELGAGMRVGVQLRVDLSSYVGPGARWRSLVVGASEVGFDRVVGSGATAGGIRVGESRLGARRVR